LNPKTGLISPQYHVVFDDNFTTIPNLRVGSKPSNWEELVRSSTEVATERDYDITRTWFKQESDPTADEELMSDDIINNVNPEDVRTNVQTNHNTSIQNSAYEGGAIGTNAPEVGNNASTARPRRSVRFATDNSQSIVNEGEISPDSSSVHEGDESLIMPSMINLKNQAYDAHLD
jgi:hypothetical protein